MSLVKSLTELNAEETARKLQNEIEMADLESRFRKQANAQVIKRLSLHVKNRWEQLKRDNKQVRTQTIQLFRRVRGEYDAQKLTDIRAFRSSEVYIRSAENKCRSAYSWITDIYRGDTDLPWSLEPTAVPALPDETKGAIKDEIINQGMILQQQMLQQSAAQGIPFDKARFQKTLNDWQQVAEEKAAQTIEKDAKRRCEKAALEIRDQNQEGGWNNAFKDFLWYFIRCKAGIIKGPTLTKQKEQVWQVLEDGTFAFVAQEKIKLDVYCVSPFNFYPAKGIASVNDGDIIEVHKLTKQAITDLIGVPGYSEIEIRIILNKLHSGDQKGKWLTIEDETAIRQIEFEKNPNNINTPNAPVSGKYPEDEVQALEYYGSVSGALLKEWGLRDEIDLEAEYQANCWQIGDHIIKAVINPDALGRKPYHVSSWAKNPSWVLGEGLIEFAEPIEDILNSIVRALQNNIAIASGPQVEINKDRCDDKSPIYPWKRWESTSAQMKEGPAVAFWQPQMHTEELIRAWEFFGKVLDEMTVPAYAQGASQSGVTAGTATVFTQLLAAASRSIKAVVANIDDDIITPYIQMCYDALMKNSKDPELKGDAHVVAKGVSGLQAKEQEAQRKVEFLQVIANPVYAQTMGAKNIGYILAQVAKSQNLALPDMERLEGLPTLDDLLTKMNMQSSGVETGGSPAMQQNGQMAAGGSPPAAQATTATGAPAGSPGMQQPAQIGV
ncbi:hypothetical protein UFOVP1138_45 [uncultured Caudovirales phage]|uniref:Uncharacterized protein n=1 Tax=uncultured Caudovirales phage TaxID=2100421 RepID=A0A6J5QNQ0_9CAUD|nr:hypothetical protein UFOVP975_76 [uncultured Caudovirales phage]CAB4186259.1 hypothetical protein UFOVP1138_45 [uncultured Caudovirales phage]CAB4204422.1 hypothetical protein UFOVP1394_42 [uncultured Caudovirales phage]